jgi:hypothetical protein
MGIGAGEQGVDEVDVRFFEGRRWGGGDYRNLAECPVSVWGFGRFVYGMCGGG